MTGYAFVPGSAFHGDANEVQAELERLRRTGGLTKRSVVAAARPKRSVLHPYVFHVDKETAAELHYEDRAGKLIVSIVIVKDDEPTSIRANVRMPSETGSVYVSIDADGAREAQIARLRRDMAALRNQLRELELYPQLALALEEALAA